MGAGEGNPTSYAAWEAPVLPLDYARARPWKARDHTDIARRGSIGTSQGPRVSHANVGASLCRQSDRRPRRTACADAARVTIDLRFLVEKQ
jgi:hypothetical protein